MTTWLKLLKWVKHIPVLFKHFAGPAGLLSAIALGAGVTIGCYLTAKFMAGSLAETKMELAECRVGHAEAVAEHAKRREAVIESAAAERAAIADENARAILEQVRALVATANDKAAIARLSKAIEDLHHDPSFGCRLLPLPPAFLDSMSISPEEVRPATGQP